MRILTKRKSQLKNPTRLVCDMCGGVIQHSLHGSYSQTSVKKRNKNDQSGGTEQRRINIDEIPSFNIDIVRRASALHDEDRLGGGITERLNVGEGGSNRSGASNNTLTDDKESFSVYNMLNHKYIDQFSDVYSLEFIIHNRTLKIQRFYKARYAKKAAAAKLICTRARMYLQ